jgi:hypothetical protein
VPGTHGEKVVDDAAADSKETSAMAASRPACGSVLGGDVGTSLLLLVLMLLRLLLRTHLHG